MDDPADAAEMCEVREREPELSPTKLEPDTTPREPCDVDSNNRSERMGSLEENSVEGGLPMVRISPSRDLLLGVGAVDGRCLEE